MHAAEFVTRCSLSVTTFGAPASSPLQYSMRLVTNVDRLCQQTFSRLSQFAFDIHSSLIRNPRQAELLLDNPTRSLSHDPLCLFPSVIHCLTQLESSLCSMCPNYLNLLFCSDYMSCCYYLRQVNEVNGGDNAFVRCVCVCLSVCQCAADRWELNANGSKTVKPTDFKFDTRVPRNSSDMTPKNFPKGGVFKNLLGGDMHSHERLLVLYYIISNTPSML